MNNPRIQTNNNPSQKPSVLIIEDDSLLVKMYKTKLESEGFSVFSSCDGEKGLKIALEIKPSVILLDIMMPELNGLEVLDRLKADPELKHIPVIVLTNLAGTQDSETALSKGAKAYLVKSEYKPKDVVTVVRGFLNQVA